MNTKLKAVIYYSIQGLIPLIPIIYLWLWFNPVGFFQQVLMLGVSIFCYILILIGVIAFISWVVDY